MTDSAFALVRVVVRGRIELPTFRFSGTRDPAGQTRRCAVSCDPRATSVLVAGCPAVDEIVGACA